MMWIWRNLLWNSHKVKVILADVVICDHSAAWPRWSTIECCHFFLSPKLPKLGMTWLIWPAPIFHPKKRATRRSTQKNSSPSSCWLWRVHPDPEQKMAAPVVPCRAWLRRARAQATAARYGGRAAFNYWGTYLPGSPTTAPTPSPRPLRWPSRKSR